METARTILSLNAGSSSRKFSLYRIAGGPESLLAEGAIEGIGTPDVRLWIRDGDKQPLASSEISAASGSLGEAFDALERLKLPAPDAIGHRLVHGGPDHLLPERITDGLLEELRRLIHFAPLHLPAAIRGIEEVTARYPNLPQVACFDTGFHRHMPEVAREFPLPRAMRSEGLRRYGFHGISYEYIMNVLGPAAPSRIVIAHLGNGASMAAVRDGKSVDTTMGFSPTGGFMMGTRTGDLDPGAIIYLLNQKHLDARGLERIVNYESGLLGVSGVSSDMKTLLERRASDPHAAHAIDMFCYQARKSIGALTAALGGIDLLVFTGGIGERASVVRAEICDGLGYLGVALDRARNDASLDVISETGWRSVVRVIPTNEDLMIARHTGSLIFSASA